MKRLLPVALAVPFLMAAVEPSHAAAIAGAIVGVAGLTGAAAAVATSILTFALTAVAGLALPLLPRARG